MLNSHSLVHRFCKSTPQQREGWAVSQESLTLETSDFRGLIRELKGLSPSAREAKVKEFSRSFLPKAEQTGFLAMDMPAEFNELDQEASSAEDAFFSLSQQIKDLFYARGETKESDGYTSIDAYLAEKAGSNGVKDHKEFFHVGGEATNWVADPERLSKLKNSDFPFNWGRISFKRALGQDITVDDFVPGFRAKVTGIRKAYEDYASLIFEIIEVGYGFPKGALTGSFSDGGLSTLRSLNYHPKQEAHGVQSDDWRSGIWAKAHFDKSALTFLRPETGLQILTSGQAGEPQWSTINAKPGQLVMNIGVAISALTNNRLPATAHRVIVDPEKQGEFRRTRPIFFHLNGNTRLEPLPSLVGSRSYYPETITVNELINGNVEGYFKRQLQAMGVLPSSPGGSSLSAQPLGRYAI